MNYGERFRVWPATTVKLKDIDPKFKDRHEDRKEAAKEIEHYRQRLRELQELLYADGRRSVLICLQALDAGGQGWDDRSHPGFDESPRLQGGGVQAAFRR